MSVCAGVCVRFYFVLWQADMPALYKTMDCFVLPSRGEGWGRPQVEAMAMGLPIIGASPLSPAALL